MRAYNKNNRSLIKVKRRQRFKLSEPNDELKEHFLVKIKRAFLRCNETFAQLVSLYEEKFQSTCESLSKNNVQSAVLQIVGKKLLLLVLNHRRQIAGHFLGTIRCIKRYAFKDITSFGVRYHVKGGEPFYREASYITKQENDKDSGEHREGKPESKEDSIILSDEEAEDEFMNKESSHHSKKWDCSAECCPIQQHDIKAIVELCELFNNPPKCIRKQLEDCDSGCPNKKDVDRKGHPLICYTANGCINSTNFIT